MPHHLDLYLRHESPLHGLDARAKLVAVAGFATAVLLAPLPPYWPAAALFVLLACTAGLARIPVRTIGRRLLPLAAIVGVSLLLSRWGSEATRLAGEQFAAKSLLVAGAFIVLLASTRAIVLLEAMGPLPIVSAFGQLGEFILRGADLLAEEVIRTNRSWRLRAQHATVRVRLVGLTQASVALLSRAAARSERIGAAMVLRGFEHRLPTGTPSPLPWSHVAAGLLFALTSLALAGVGRWS